jgi:hypothetical protein
MVRYEIQELPQREPGVPRTLAAAPTYAEIFRMLFRVAAEGNHVAIVRIVPATDERPCRVEVESSYIRASRRALWTVENPPATLTMEEPNG